jgi:hypothetical protein
MQLQSRNIKVFIHKTLSMSLSSVLVIWQAHAPPFSMDRQVQREGRLREMYGGCFKIVGRRGVELK